MSLTPWFSMKQTPVRQGRYEGRERRTRARIVVYWRKLHDHDAAGWYFHKGYLGPFQLWEDATEKMTAWRGRMKGTK